MQQTENLAPHIQEIARALQNKMDPGAIEDELRRYLDYGVPLNQAKRDIVRMHGGSLNAGEKKVESLQPEDRGVELVGRILTVNPKEITVKGEPKQIFFGFFADDTGKASYTSWKDHNLQKGANVRIKNAYVKKGFREGIEISLGDYTQVLVMDALPFDVKDEFASGAAGPSPSGEFASRASVERKVKELREGQGSVTITGRILDLREKAVSTASGQKTLVEGELADETGRVGFSAWEPDKLPPEFKANAVVRIKSGYVKAFRGVPNVNLNQYTQVEILPAAAMPDLATLDKPTAFTLGELESVGGAQSALVEGVVLDVKKGSGLIFRCGFEGCTRVLLNKECRTHGKQKGVPDLRIKAVLDDGLGAATFFTNREATERILGKSLDQCQELAREAMTVDVIQDELAQKLTARRVLVTGRVLNDEFGLQIIANDIVFAPAKDAAAAAEALLAQLAELTEVSQ